MSILETNMIQSPETAVQRPTAASVVIITPPRGWQLVNFAELWKSRELLVFLTWRDVMVRYKQTVLGIAWAILQPALMMVDLHRISGPDGAS